MVAGDPTEKQAGADDDLNVVDAPDELEDAVEDPEAEPVDREADEELLERLEREGRGV